MRQALTFQKIQHLITAIDCQPMFDGGILINVIGQLKVRAWEEIIGKAYDCSDLLGQCQYQYSC